MRTSCTRIRSMALDAERTSRAVPAEVTAHLTGCAACRDAIATQSALWHELALLPTPRPTAAASERIAQRLQHEITIRSQENKPMKTMWLAAAAVVGMLFGGAGTQLLQRSDDAQEAGQQYLLLLHEDARTMSIPQDQLPAVIAEYSAWAGKLHENEQLVSAEKLRDDGGRWLAADGTLLSVDRTEGVSGFFLIRADSYEEALAVARQSPHLKYGGTIEVRGIEQTSSD